MEINKDNIFEIMRELPQCQHIRYAHSRGGSSWFYHLSSDNQKRIRSIFSLRKLPIDNVFIGGFTHASIFNTVGLDKIVKSLESDVSSLKNSWDKTISPRQQEFIDVANYISKVLRDVLGIVSKVEELESNSPEAFKSIKYKPMTDLGEDILNWVKEQTGLYAFETNTVELPEWVVKAKYAEAVEKGKTSIPERFKHLKHWNSWYFMDGKSSVSVFYLIDTFEELINSYFNENKLSNIRLAAKVKKAMTEMFEMFLCDYIYDYRNEYSEMLGYFRTELEERHLAGSLDKEGNTSYANLNKMLTLAEAAQKIVDEYNKTELELLKKLV